MTAEYQKLFEREGKEIENLSDTISGKEVEELKDLIVNAPNNIFFTGCGTSAMDAKKIVHTLRVVELKTFFLNPSDAVHGALGVISPGDIVVFISKSGSTKELTSFLPNLKEKNVKIVTVTENPKSEIALQSDLVTIVKINNELDEFGLLATTSSLAVISLFDVIACLIMKESKFTKKQFLINHPSGAVGEKLKNSSNRDRY